MTLNTIQARLISINEKIDDLKDLISLYQEHLADLKKELSELRNEILAITLDLLMRNTQKQEDNIFGIVWQSKLKNYSSQV